MPFDFEVFNRNRVMLMTRLANQTILRESSKNFTLGYVNFCLNCQLLNSYIITDLYVKSQSFPFWKYIPSRQKTILKPSSHHDNDFVHSFNLWCWHKAVQLPQSIENLLIELFNYCLFN